jgi:hypothetical protein
MSRKFALVGIMTFASSLFGIEALTQPRRPRRPPVAAPAPVDEPPTSNRIAQELQPLRWGITHEQVLEFFRLRVRAEYAPRAKNLGQIELFRLNSERDRDIRRIEQTYVVFDGDRTHRAWDQSLVGEEYTHNNNESMLVYADAQGNREFFFFINDRLWKRARERRLVGSRDTFAQFADQLDALFGAGRRRMNGARLDFVDWRDETSHLRVHDQRTFYDLFLFVYEDLGTLSNLATLRRNVPTKNVRAAGPADMAQPEVGNVSGDPNADIVDRITGKIRRVSSADAGAAASASVTGAPVGPGSAGRTSPAGVAGTNAGRTPAARVDAGIDDNDPLGGLGF